MSHLKVKSKSYFFRACLLVFVIATLVGCGGGGGSKNPDDIIGTGIQGTAATGAALANATITVKSKSGATQSDISDANGKFKVDDLADDGPYLLRVDKGNGNFLYSVAHSNNTATINRNIHPYTDLIVRNWFKIKGLDLDAEFAGAGAIASMPTQEEVDDIKDEIQAIVAQVLDKNGVAADVDLLSTPFDADSTGFDGFLDNSSVIINNNQITIIINDPVTNIQNLIVNNINLDIDFTSPEDAAPTMPGNLRALPASSSEIVVVWDASTDDKGVAGYNVYRNGTLVGTTPYPVYRDTGLAAKTNYSYTVEAIDGRGQVSAKTPATTPFMLDTPDITAPPVPTDLQASPDDSSAALTWSQAEIDDVVGFRILRGARGNATTLVAIVTSTTYTDLNLVSATEYCYRVEAYDAADPEANTSGPSSEACVTTDGTVAPSSVSFSSATYKVNENVTSITISVNRAGDISEAISVDYAASNGTAVDGEDFSVTSGTLNWAATDNNAKTFDVQIISDSATEGDETVNLALSSPSANTSLGTNTTAVLTIIDIIVGVCNGEITARNIDVDTTLSESCYKVPNGISVNSPAKLTIDPGVRLEFAAGTDLVVNQGASLYAVGTVAEEIIFTALDAMPGYWRGIRFNRSNSLDNQLDYVAVEYGVTNIGIESAQYDPSRLGVKNTTLRYASDLGMNIDDSRVLLEAFENNTMTLNDRPVRLPAETVWMLGNDSRYSGNIDDRIHVFDENVVTEQTWQKLDVPYYMYRSSPFSYGIDAALTLEAGVSLIFNSNARLSVNESGSLKAIGTAAEPILFTGLVEMPGYWRGIRFFRSNSLDNQLDYVTVEYGVTNIGIESAQYDPSRLGVKNTTLRYASNLGMNIDDSRVLLSAFESNTMTLNDRPIRLPAEKVGALGNDSRYSGNTNDQIHVFDENVVTEQTWKKLDVPYYMYRSSPFSYGIDAALTLEAGVSLIFNSNARLSVNESGSLKAIGTAAEPILFTGLVEMPGYWRGIRFFRSNSLDNQLDYVTVEYAGGGGSEGNIVLACISSPFYPTRLSVINSTIKDSFSWGIYTQYPADGCNIITLTDNAYSNNASGNVNIP
ncbi:MAG: hypothetical protein L3J88_12975 [Gammaproteobacteria bacterium]|nr:hypothetical protein [Gammaproteobacteria bacterium]